MSFVQSSISLLLLASLLTACHRKSDDSPVVARAYNYELHLSDLAGLVGEGVSSEDSATIVANYVEQWIRQAVILTKAEKNIHEDFEKQLREYRNSLLTYAYEQKILNQLLDTNVSADQIAEYYEQHQDDFKLRSAIVKTVYVVAPLKSPALPKIKKVFSKKDLSETDIYEIETLATRHGYAGYYDAESWLPFYTLQRNVPITTYNENLYLRQNRTIQLNDDSSAYLVRILDYKVSDEISPLELQSENIRSIILNRRKLDILDRLQTDLLEEAEKSDKVKRYL